LEAQLNANEVGEIRRSAAVQVFGPGAIVDMRSAAGLVSGLHAGLEEWDLRANDLNSDFHFQRVYERRLMHLLKKDYFRLTPIFPEPRRGDSSPNSLVLKRFPTWLQCPVCNLVKHSSKWRSEPGYAYRFCQDCTSASANKSKKVFVFPTRFIQVCEKGHLDDFPWKWWVHDVETTCDSAEDFTLISARPGLEGLILSCRKCKSSKSMAKVFGKNGLSGLVCRGKRPWLREDDIACDCSGVEGSLRAVQRAGSNVYYPVLQSALVIPPWSDRILQILQDSWADLESVDESQRVQWLRSAATTRDRIARAGYTIEEFVKTFNEALKNSRVEDLETIKSDEFLVLSSSVDPTPSADFEVHSEKLVDTNKVAKLSRVPRLREIRVLTGFTRINPPLNKDADKIAPLSCKPLSWLPAIEVRGEGIFLSLNDENLHLWSRQEAIAERFELLNKRWEAAWTARYPNAQPPDKITPQFMAIHSLSHALIQQLSFDSGYNAASLRERIYSYEDSKVGVLIHTATSDSEGTLGGLQAKGKVVEFQAVLSAALENMNWCASDPVCSHGDLMQVEAFSFASCHSCLMIPETSCEFNNMFLDRAMLIGEVDGTFKGYFGD
jgi:hypothetical protein